jgi:hypothetical protein
VQDSHLERASATPDRLSYPAEADDAERRSSHVTTEEVGVGPATRPASGADRPVARDDAPSRREDERERQVGCGGIEDAGRVGHHHAASRGDADVDRVVADPEVRDQPEIGQAIQSVFVDLFADDREGLDVVAPCTDALRQGRVEVLDVGQPLPGRPRETT